VRLARKLQATESEAAGAAVQKILDTCKSPSARQLAESAGIVLGDMVNLAPQGTATSPDGLEKDGAASGDQAAIDGNPDTYWDEADGAKLYRLVVAFQQPVKIAALSLLGHAHHSYAPKDFEVICDGQPVKKIENAQYTDNFLAVQLPETACQTVELKITGNHGNSPAIRELGLYRRQPRSTAGYRVLLFSKTLGFRHSNIPLGVSTLRRLGAENGFALDATEESAVFTSANLARYKAVVFLSVTGDVLNGDQEKAFMDYVLGGGGFAAIHGALYGPSACEDQWAWYGELCCAPFKNHSAIVPAQVDVEDRKNPSTADLPARWARTDEWYNYSSNPRGCARVLATLDESTYPGGTMGKDHPIAWCRSMGQGRVWYTAMGHTEESFGEPLFLKHVLGGIELVAGVKPGELAPNDKPARNE
ncbi:MAG: ThuA domain-containing protein, partial [Chloroflexi bacterium]|nr:ThuA domain-containing protein [Chloroflexota bacterium]